VSESVLENKEMKRTKSRLEDDAPLPARRAVLHQATQVLLGALFAVLATVLQNVLWEWIGPSRFILYYPAIIFAALLGGLTAGISAIGISALLAVYYFIPPTGTFAIASLRESPQLVAFILSGISITILNSLLIRRTRELEKAKTVSSQHERLQTILDTLPVTTVILDSRHRVIETHGNADQVFIDSGEHSTPIWENTNVRCLWTNNDQTIGARDWPSMQALLNNVVVAPREITIVRPGESPVHILTGAAPFRDSGGHVIGAVVAIQEISLLRETEALLAFERHKLDAIFQLSPAAMALWRGPGMVFELANPAFQALFGGRDLKGKEFLEALPEFEGQPFTDYFRRVMETGESFTGREVLAKHRRTKDGPIEDRYYDFCYVRINDWEGKPYGVYDHAIDVTERVQERELRERFVAAFSHDLRTPLTAVKMSTQLLTRRWAEAPPEAQKITSRIAENIDRADQMIRDLLDVSRLKAGENIQIEIGYCDLRNIATDVLGDLSTIHGNRFTLQADKPIKGFWDSKGIRRILENLCGNAIKYGAPDRAITVSIDQTEEKVEIRVHNEGNPIPPEIQSKIFEPFRRASSVETRKPRGWGLGLALVKGLTEANGGTVRLNSSPDTGTIFTVILPNDARKQVSRAA